MKFFREGKEKAYEVLQRNFLQRRSETITTETIKTKEKVKIKISFIGGGFSEKETKLEFDKGKTYLDLLNIFNINPETVLLLKNGTPVPLDDEISDGEVKVMRVISGG